MGAWERRGELFQSTEIWGAREEDGSHGGIALLEGEERLSSSHAKPRGFTRELQ